jgi:hypothetical protein
MVEVAGIGAAADDALDTRDGARSAGTRLDSRHMPRRHKKTREHLSAPAGSLSFKLVEVAGIEPACPWPLRMASTLIVPF